MSLKVSARRSSLEISETSSNGLDLSDQIVVSAMLTWDPVELKSEEHSEVKKPPEAAENLDQMPGNSTCADPPVRSTLAKNCPSRKVSNSMFDQLSLILLYS